MKVMMNKELVKKWKNLTTRIDDHGSSIVFRDRDISMEELQKYLSRSSNLIREMGDLVNETSIYVVSCIQKEESIQEEKVEVSGKEKK